MAGFAAFERLVVFEDLECPGSEITIIEYMNRFSAELIMR